MTIDKLWVFLSFLFFASAQGLYYNQSEIIQLTQHNFDSLVSDTDEMWLVEFYAPWCGHCKAFAPDYEKLAKIFRGVIKVGAVDMTKDESVGSRFGVKGYPTIFLFASRKEPPHELTKTRSIEGIISFVLEQMHSLVDRRRGQKASSQSKQKQPEPTQSSGNSQNIEKDGEVFILTDANFDSVLKNSKDIWMMKFYAPWCGHCKSMAPSWKEAARRLQGKVKFGEVDATAHTNLARRYGVKGYPTLKVFLPGKDLNNPLDYQGQRSTEAFESAAMEYLRSNPAKKEVLQLTSESVMQDECASKNGICLVAFLPHLADTGAAGRNDYIKILADAASKNMQYPFFFFWSQAYDQKELEKAFNLNSGYPIAVAISHSKGKYAVMRGAYTLEGVVEFIRDLMHGFEQLHVYESLPKVKEIKKWDGSDYKEES